MCFYNSLYVEGVQWSDVQMGLEESQPRTLYTRLSVKRRKRQINCTIVRCTCLLYNMSERLGQLSTTGHSTNFIMYLQLGSGEMDPDHWCKRGTGTAFLMPLDSQGTILTF